MERHSCLSGFAVSTIGNNVDSIATHGRELDQAAKLTRVAQDVQNRLVLVFGHRDRDLSHLFPAFLLDFPY